MDLNPRRIAVHMVGLSMAMVGLFLSIIAPAVITILPHVQPRMPALEARTHSRPRITSTAHSQLSSNGGSSSSSGSADSVVTAESSATSTASHTEMQTPKVASRRNTLFLPAAESTPPSGSSSSKPPCSPRACLARVRRIGSSPRRLNSASTSASSSRERRYNNEKDPESEFAAVLTTSPTHSVLNLATPGTSDVESRLVGSSSSPIDRQVPRGEIAPSKRLGRARTLFSLRRVSRRPKMGSRAETSTSLPQITALPSAKSADNVTTPPLFSSQNAVSVSSTVVRNNAARRSKSTPAKCLDKIRGKGKGKGKKGQGESGSFVRTESESEVPSRRASICLPGRSRSRGRPDSRTPVPRTRPYEAPYNFPMPTSPELEFTPYTTKLAGITQITPPASRQNRQSLPLKTDSINSTPQTAPAHRVEFVRPAHARAASFSVASSQLSRGLKADEFGFAMTHVPGPSAHPLRTMRASPLRHEAQEQAVPIARSATLPGNDWTNIEGDARTTSAHHSNSVPSPHGQQSPRPFLKRLSGLQ